MLRKLTLLGAVAAGVLLITLGAQKMLDRRAAEQVARTFMAALTEGDRATLLTLLPPENRAALEDSDSDEHPLQWVQETGVTYRIHHIDMQGEVADVRLWIEKDGFNLKPLLRLKQSDTGVWKVAGIDDLDIDRRWEDLQRERGREDGEQLAEELAEALGDLPGVEVDRVSFAEAK